jgi:hypothetical protein
MLLHMTYVQGMEAALEGIASEGRDLALEVLENHCSPGFVAQLVVSESIDQAEPESHDERVALHLLRGLSMGEKNDVLSRAHTSLSEGFRDPGNA